MVLLLVFLTGKANGIRFEIVLRGPGPRGSGLDTPGAIDVTNGDTVFTLERPGLAMFAWSGGTFGPFELSDEASARLSALLRAAPTSGADSSPGDVASAALDSGDAPFLGEPGPGGADGIEPTIDCKPSGQGDPIQSPGGQSSSSCNVRSPF